MTQAFSRFPYVFRHPQSGILYFRFQVPKKYRQSFGRCEIRRSLHTKEKNVALPLAVELYSDIQRKINKIENMSRIPTDSMGKIVVGDIVIDHGGDTEKELAHAKELLAIQQGQQAAPKQPAHSTDALKLGEVIQKYAAENSRLGGWTGKTKAEGLAIFQVLKEILRNPIMETIGHVEANRVKETLQQLPPHYRKKYPGKTIPQAIRLHGSRPSISAVTYRKYIRRISTLFTWSVHAGYCHDNPFRGTRFPKGLSAHKQRKRFDRADLVKLFHPDHYCEKNWHHSYQKWLPLLGLYSGCRINELCQLHIEDIYEVDGIAVLDINNRNGKRLKNASSERLIPIHPNLVEYGFLDHVDALRKRKQKRLFSELKKHRDGHAQMASKWFNDRYRKKCGVTEKGKTFHSFRHTFADELRQCGVPQEKIEGLTGHAGSGEIGTRYGKAFRPDVLYPVICQFSLDGMK